MTRILLALALACVAAPAMAAVQGTAETAFSLPWGDIVIQVCSLVFNVAEAIAVPVIFAYLTYRWPVLKVILTEPLIRAQVDAGRKAGMNSVAGAVQGREIKIDAGSKVIAEGAKYLIHKADVNLLARKCIEWAGGPQEIARRIWAGLHLDAEATKDNTLVPALTEIAAYAPPAPAKKTATVKRSTAH